MHSSPEQHTGLDTPVSLRPDCALQAWLCSCAVRGALTECSVGAARVAPAFGYTPSDGLELCGSTSLFLLRPQSHSYGHFIKVPEEHA